MILVLPVKLTLAGTAPSSPVFTGHVQPFVFSFVPAPSIPFFDSVNQLHRLSDFKGQVLVVNLWATWCAACLQEMPELEALQQTMGEQGVTVLALNQDLPEGEKVRRFLDVRGYSGLTAYRDINMLFGEAVGQKLLPMTLLFDRSGQGIGYLIGPADWNSAAARALISRYLNE
ncbi:TlpA family protein disulfide reductase [Amphritea sp. HPY]|uniref:TlpA family protein disulfide reductase n=1 Tax=Amphritea sp. HPY TaxID=3421652 RepID=UPI003D7C67E5